MEKFPKLCTRVWEIYQLLALVVDDYEMKSDSQSNFRANKISV